MNKLKKVGAWLGKNVWAVVVGVLGLLLAAAAWALRRSAPGDSSEDVAQARAEIAAKEARAAALEEQGDAAGSEVERLRAEVEASKRRVVEIHAGEPLEGKSDDEIADLFTRAGF